MPDVSNDEDGVVRSVKKLLFTPTILVAVGGLCASAVGGWFALNAKVDLINERQATMQAQVKETNDHVQTMLRDIQTNILNLALMLGNQDKKSPAVYRRNLPQND